MNKAWAFLKRDYLIATSYKAEFLFRLGSVVFAVPLCYFAGESLALRATAAKHGGSYFAFLLIGLGLLGYLTVSLRSFTRIIRESQMMGTLEILILSPTSVTQLLVYSSLFLYIFQTVRFLSYLAGGVVFGLPLASGNPISAIAVLALSVPAFAAFGILVAALSVIIKRSEAIGMALYTGSLLLGGVVLPVEDLPVWLQAVANALPITHSLHAMRLALFQGASLSDLVPQLVALGAFALVLLPISLGLFALAIRHNKVNGTLAQY